MQSSDTPEPGPERKAGGKYSAQTVETHQLSSAGGNTEEGDSPGPTRAELFRRGKTKHKYVKGERLPAINRRPML